MDQSAQDEVVFSVGTQIDRTAGVGSVSCALTTASAGGGNAMMTATSFWCWWRGKCAVTVRRSDGRQTVHHAERGDVLLIPKGAAHSFTLHTPEVQVLLVTPRGKQHLERCGRRRSEPWLSALPSAP
jgi:hypothetical protein